MSAETMADYEAQRQMEREEADEVRWQREQDRERIEFIRRAYLARLATHPDPTRITHSCQRGILTGTDALRYLAEQDWEAVREL